MPRFLYWISSHLPDFLFHSPFGHSLDKLRWKFEDRQRKLDDKEMKRQEEEFRSRQRFGKGEGI